MAFWRFEDILKSIRERNPRLDRRLQEAEAVVRWDATVGPAIAKHSRALRVEDGVLWVEVDHPVWKSELHHRKRQVLDLLNGGDPKKGLTPAAEHVRDILFVDPRRART